MNYKITTKTGSYEVDFLNYVSWNELHSINDHPAIETLNGAKNWYFDGKLHRENGPAIIDSNGYYSFWLNGEFYGTNVQKWLENHPNKDKAFQCKMLLQYS